jgi:hypothetical protein
MGVDTAPMTLKTKRTYNLHTATVERVRALAAQGEAGGSQDAVVEAAIEQFYRQVRDREEAAQWAAAARDPEFSAEIEVVASAYDTETWPK